jgi:PAS domain S-box-containing protein
MATSIKDRIKEIGNLNNLLADNLVDAIWVIDTKSLRYEYISPSIYKVSGYSDDELINTSLIDRLTPESLAKAKKELARSLTEYKQGKRTSRMLELEITHKNGSTYWIEIWGKVFEEPAGQFKLVGITKEITTRKKAEKKQEDLHIQLVEALAEKEKLIQENKILKKLLPICSGCKRIRDDNGRWWPLDAYIREHTGSDFTHTICLDCKDVLYPNMIVMNEK